MPKIAQIDDKLRERARKEVVTRVEKWMQACPAFPAIYNAYNDSPFYKEEIFDQRTAYKKIAWNEIVQEVEKKVISLIVGAEQQKAVDKFLEDFDKLKEQLGMLQDEFENHDHD